MFFKIRLTLRFRGGKWPLLNFCLNYELPYLPIAIGNNSSDLIFAYLRIGRIYFGESLLLLQKAHMPGTMAMLSPRAVRK